MFAAWHPPVEDIDLTHRGEQNPHRRRAERVGNCARYGVRTMDARARAAPGAKLAQRKCR